MIVKLLLWNYLKKRKKMENNWFLISQKSSINKKTTACCHYAYGTLPGRNAPLSTTCLPLICAKNRRNRLKITTIALLKNAAKSGFFAFYSRPHQVCGLIQFPYGSPQQSLGNSVVSRFPRLYFFLKSPQPLICHLF